MGVALSNHSLGAVVSAFRLVLKRLYTDVASAGLRNGTSVRPGIDFAGV